MSGSAIENNPPSLISLPSPFPMDDRRWDAVGISNLDHLNSEVLEHYPDYPASIPATIPEAINGFNFTDFYQNETVRLDMLLRILQDRDVNITRHQPRERYFHSSMDLIIVQLSLVAILVSISVCWACCFKRRSNIDSSSPNVLSSRISNLARKISGLSFKDLPPNYSRVDLTTFGLSIHDHYNPPPHYEAALQSRNSPPHKALQLQPLGHGSLSSQAVGIIPEQPILVIDPKTRKISSISLPASTLINPHPTGIIMDRRVSVQSDVRPPRSRRVAFSEGPRVHFADLARRLSNSQTLGSDPVIAIPEEESDEVEPRNLGRTTVIEIEPSPAERK